MTSVTVLVRARPLSASEIAAEAKVILKMDKYKTYINTKEEEKLKMKRRSKSEHFFFFERSYWSVDRNNENFADQKTIYEEYGTKIVESALNGYNACLFAYGQTGSGKTYTMMGNVGNRGVIPRICDDLFANLNDEKTTFRVEISYIEIYNEQVHDLLKRNVKKSPKSLKLREHPRDGPFVQGLTVHPVTDYASIESLLEEGNNIRATAATNMNSVSSRSHAIFTIKLSQAKLIDNIPSETTSKVNLVDLAGSERVGSSGTTGSRFKEGAFINKSLVILSLVISALAENSSPVKVFPRRQVFVPYRDSVLTWLLKDSLGGNSRTIMIAAVSPADSSYSETLSTLKYASQARKVINRPVINEDPNVKLIRELRAEITELQNLLSIYKISQNDNCKDKDIMQARLHENQERVENLTKNWIDKNMEAQRIFKEKSVQLCCKGQQTVLSTVKVHLISMEDDPLNTDIIIYHLNEGETLVGNFEITESNCIDLKCVGIEKNHCSIFVSTNKVSIAPTAFQPIAFHTYLNDIQITTECYLRHGDILKFGEQRFRFCNPFEAEQLRINRTSGIFSLDVSPLVMDHYRSTECFKDLEETDAALLENRKNKQNLLPLQHDTNELILRKQTWSERDRQVASSYKHHRLSFPGKFDNNKTNQALDKKFNSTEILCSSPMSFQLEQSSSNSESSCTLSAINDTYQDFFDPSRLDQSNDVSMLDQFNLKNSGISLLGNQEKVSNISLNKNSNKETKNENSCKTKNEEETKNEDSCKTKNEEEKRILLQDLISNYFKSEIERIEYSYENIRRASVNINLFMTQYSKLEELHTVLKEHLKNVSSELFNFKNKILEEKYLQRSGAMLEINNSLLRWINNENDADDGNINEQKIIKKNYVLKKEIEDYWKKMDLYHDLLVISNLGKYKLLYKELLVMKFKKYISERHHQVVEVEESMSKSKSRIGCLTTDIDKCHLNEKVLKQEIEKVKTEYLAKSSENEEYYKKLCCSHEVELDVLKNELSTLNEQIEHLNDLAVDICPNNTSDEEYIKHIATNTFSADSIESKHKDFILELKCKRDFKQKYIEETNQKIHNSILDCRYTSLQLQDEMHYKVAQNEKLLKSMQDQLYDIQKQLNNELLNLKYLHYSLSILQYKSYIEKTLETYSSCIDLTSETYNSYMDSFNCSQETFELSNAQLKESLENKIKDELFSLEELLVSLPHKKAQKGCLTSYKKCQRGMFDKTVQLVFHSANPFTHIDAISKLHITYENTKYLLMVTLKEICLLFQEHLKLHLEFIKDYLQKSGLDDIHKNGREKICDLMNQLDLNESNSYIKNYRSEEMQVISFQNKIKRLENEMCNKIIQVQRSSDSILLHCNAPDLEEIKDLQQFYSLCSHTETADAETADEDFKSVWFSTAECACLESLLQKLQTEIMQEQQSYLTMLRKLENEKEVAVTGSCLKRRQLFQNEGNQAAGDLLREIHFCSVLIDSVEKFKENIDEKKNSEEKNNEKCYSVGGWKYKSNHDGTVVMRKNPEQPGYLCVMACSVINVQPQLVWDAIRNPLFRLVHDDTVEKIHVIEHCNERLKIIYLRQKMKSLFYTQTHLDCCCAHAERVESNQYVLTYVSVNHPECPVIKNVHRLNVGPSGWVVKLLVNEIGEKSSIVWYLVNVQCGEAVSQHVLNNLCQKIPLSIAALRSYLVH